MELTENLKWLEHASFLIKEKNCVIYIEPWNLKYGLPLTNIILVTYEHFDYYSKVDIEKILKPDTVVACNSACFGKFNWNKNTTCTTSAENRYRKYKNHNCSCL